MWYFFAVVLADLPTMPLRMRFALYHAVVAALLLWFRTCGVDFLYVQLLFFFALGRGLRNDGCCATVGFAIWWSLRVVRFPIIHCARLRCARASQKCVSE